MYFGYNFIIFHGKSIFTLVLKKLLGGTITNKSKGQGTRTTFGKVSIYNYQSQM